MSNIGTETGTLPRPTTDLARCKADLDEFGYALLADALPPAQVEAVRARLAEQAAAEKRLGHAFEDGGPRQQWGGFRGADGRLRPDAFTEAAGGVNQRVWMLVNKGRVFLDLLLHDQVLQLAEHLLGDEFLLSSYTANIAKPGSVAMDLHTDQWWAPAPTRPDRRPLPVGSITRGRFDEDDRPRPLIAPAAAINVIWMLSDFSESNGGTRLVPRSHLSGRQPDKARDKDVETIAATGPAGTAVLIDGRLWHGTGANIGNAPRWAVLITYCGPQYRPQENFTVGTDPAVLADASDRLKALLGFKVWYGYGRVEQPTVEFIGLGERSLPELRPDEPA